MIQKGGDALWQKRRDFWDRCIRKATRFAEPCEKHAEAEDAVSLFAIIIAFSLLGIWAELTLPAFWGVGIKYGLTAVFAVAYAIYSGIKPAEMGITQTRCAGFLLLFVIAPNGVFRLFQCACEEFIYRGAVFASVSRWWGVAAGFTVSTVAFVLMHPGAGPLAWLQCAGFGLFACWYVHTHKEIWGIIAIHTAWNLIYDFRLAVGL
jgi:membrane protease YdiL (CAAX protease family)